jgi:salicylate hydroxylase
MSKSSLHVAIIGGGIGGLCLAQGLKKSGVSVAVYERDRTPTDRLQGYRIHISPKGSRALSECLPPELFEAFTSTCSISSDRFTFLTDQMEELLTVDTMPHPGENHGHRSISRITLRQLLLSGLDDVVHFNKTFVRYEEAGDGRIEAQFEDSTAVTCDVLVAADGGNSRVRRQFLPNAKRIDTGVRGVAGKFMLTEESRKLLAPALLHGPCLVLTPQRRSMFTALQEFEDSSQTVMDNIGTNHYAAAQPGCLFDNTKSYAMWALGMRSEDLGSRVASERIDGAELQSMVSDTIAAWHSSLRDLVKLSDPSTVSLLPIRSSVPIPHWKTTNITLLGDAIHSMTPYRGIGANVALCDASLLRQNLVAVHRGEKPLLGALHDYEVAMVKYGFSAVRKSMRAVEQAVTDNRFEFFVRTTAFRFLNALSPVKRYVFRNFGDN